MIYDFLLGIIHMLNTLISLSLWGHLVTHNFSPIFPCCLYRKLHPADDHYTEHPPYRSVWWSCYYGNDIVLKQVHSYQRWHLLHTCEFIASLKSELPLCKGIQINRPIRMQSSTFRVTSFWMTFFLPLLWSFIEISEGTHEHQKSDLSVILYLKSKHVTLCRMKNRIRTSKMSFMIEYKVTPHMILSFLKLKCTSEE